MSTGAPPLLIEPDGADRRAIYGNIQSVPVRPDVLEHIARSYVLSPFSFYWQKGERTHLFHSVLLKKATGSALLHSLLRFLSKPSREVENLSSGEKGFLQQAVPELIRHQFLIPSRENASALLRGIRSDPLFSSATINVLYLSLTGECNLRCPYCFVTPRGTRRPSPAFMKNDVVETSLGLFEEVSADCAGTPTVIFYGGEPLLNWKTLCHGARYVHRRRRDGGFRGRDVHMEVFTNATLVDREKACFLRDYGIHPVVSMDGRAGHHNYFRTMPGGRGSYEDTLKGYAILREAGLQPTLSCTLGTHNIGDLEDIIAFFQDELSAVDIRFFPLKGLAPDSSYEIAGEEVAGRLTGLWASMEKRGLRENIVGDILYGIARGQRNHFSCEAYGGQIAVIPDGGIGPCINLAEDHHFLAGNVRDGGIRGLITGMAVKWRSFSPFLREECRKCIAMGICGGGCVHESFIKKGTLEGQDEKWCAMMPEIVRWAIETISGRC